MITNNSSLIIKLKEGGAGNYMEALSQKLGGTMTQNHLVLEKSNEQVDA